MNRREALRILGLDETATAADIKIAYREMAQILHPDRFAGNKKLEERATEQFKNLQEAYEFLASGKTAAAKGSAASHAQASAPGRASRRRPRSTTDDIEAQLAGIAAARVQLVAQRDLALDERRNGGIALVAGAIVAFVFGRRPWGLYGAIAAIGVTLAIWGIARLASSQRTIATIDEHLDRLSKEKARLLSLLDDT